MERISVDDENLREKLIAARGVVELYEGNGRPLGWFDRIDPAELEPQVSDEEIERRIREAEANPASTFTTAEVLEHLRSL
ncbi:MAG: hypothetical protein KY476_10375 [Planctomycetes bacterium]|nr:hypothetical protein [Planctomycetota bacterium]